MYYVGMSGADTENRGQGDNDVRDATSRGELSVFLKEVEQLKRSCQPDGLVKCHMKRCAHKIGRVHLCHDLICQPDDVAEPQDARRAHDGRRQIIDNITRLPRPCAAAAAQKK